MLNSYYFFEILATYVEFMLLYAFCDRLFEPRFTKNKQRLVKQFLTAILTTLVTLANIVALFSYITAFVGVPMVALASSILYKEKFISIKNICIFSVTYIYYATVLCIDFLSVSFISTFFPGITGYNVLNVQNIYRIVHLVFVKSIGILVYFLMRRHLHKNVIKPEYFFYLFLISFLIKLSSFFVNQLSSLWLIEDSGIKYVAVFVHTLNIIITFLAFVITKKLTELNEAREYLHISEVLNEKQGTEYLNYSQLDTENAKIRHELKNHFLVVSRLIQEDKVDACKKYLEKCSFEEPLFHEFAQTGSDIVDMVLKSRIYLAKKSHILLNYTGVNLTNIHIEEKDICSILSNLLDNAIEACNRQAPEAKKTIDVTISEQWGLLRIEVSNTVDTPPVIKNGRIATSKADKNLHGFGLQVIKDCVKKYHGDMNFSYDEIAHTFSVALTLCLA